MIKRLLLSAVATTAMAFSASADTLDMLPSIGNGWGSSYDAATKTITFEGAWKGYGWWLDGADYSKYDEMVVEFVENAQTVQLVIEYAENENESVQAAAGKPNSSPPQRRQEELHSPDLSPAPRSRHTHPHRRLHAERCCVRPHRSRCPH